jgi:hypothetical protein
LDDLNSKPEAAQLAAVQREGKAIQFIQNPSEAVQLTAVQQHEGAIAYIKNPSEYIKTIHAALWVM